MLRFGFFAPAKNLFAGACALSVIVREFIAVVSEFPVGVDNLPVPAEKFANTLCALPASAQKFANITRRLPANVRELPAAARELAVIARKLPITPLKLANTASKFANTALPLPAPG